MRIAVSADNDNGLDSVVSPHFGRCPYYVLVDLEGQEVQQVNAVAGTLKRADLGSVLNPRNDAHLVLGYAERTLHLDRRLDRCPVEASRDLTTEGH